jgi:putative ABC transport system permease protein
MAAFIENLLQSPVNMAALLVSALVILAGLAYIVTSPRMALLAVKNLRRNLVRTLLTSMAIMVLVVMVTLIWTVIFFLDQTMTEKSTDLKLIIMEKWKVPSMLPITHADYLNPENPKCLPLLKELGVEPKDFMTWSFYGGTTDGTTDMSKVSLDKMIFFFVMDPRAIRPMMDDLENFSPELVKKLQDKRDGCLIGPDRLQALNKKVGERFKITSINYKGIDLEFEIVGTLPPGRYDKSAIMNESYFNEAMEKYFLTNKARHPLDQMRLNLIWLRVRDQATFNKVGKAIEESPYFADRPIKCETSSAGIGSFMAAYRDIIGWFKFLMVPAILISMALVVANAISISVRERRGEIAVLKVLGYRPFQILELVMGESIFVGALSGFIAALLTFTLVNLAGGINVQVGFFPSFMISTWALCWGLAMGAGTAFLGGILPALSARAIKVSEVFSKVA